MTTSQSFTYGIGYEPFCGFTYCIWWYIVKLDLVIAFCDFIMSHCDILFEDQFSKLNKCIIFPLHFTQTFKNQPIYLLGFWSIDLLRAIVMPMIIGHQVIGPCHHEKWQLHSMDNGVFLYLLYIANKNYALIENQSHTIETNGLFSKGKPVLLQLQVGIDFVRFACTSMCWYA